MNLKKEIIKFIKFGLVGVFNTLSSTCYYWILVYFGVNYLLSTTISYFLSSIIGYFLNDKMVFRQKNKSKLAIMRYYIVYGTSYLLNMICMYIYIDVLHLSQYIAPLLVLFITVPYNFILSRFWVFKGDDKNDNK